MGVTGATRWLTSSKALIQVTLQFATQDHLWFTIFHESFHILKHQKRGVFLEANGAKNPAEIEADEFSFHHLIPPAPFRRFAEAGMFDPRTIESFAESIAIAPGIVVGRLEKEGLIPLDSLNDLKVKFDWSNES